MEGYTIIFIPFESDEGLEVVYGRYHTENEKDIALKEAIKELDEIELQTLTVVNNYNYMLSR